MYYILLGLLGFLFMSAAEYCSQKNVGLIKPILWVLSTGLLVYALVMGWIDSPRLAVPQPLGTLGWIGLFFFGGLFVYSIVLEVPFRASYIERSSGARLVTGGTYALTRHPGILWAAGWLIATVLVSGSVVLAWAFPFWMAADIALVYIEEKVNLEKAFGQEYKQYQETTPMIIPTRSSLLRFFRTNFAFITRTRN